MSKAKRYKWDEYQQYGDKQVTSETLLIVDDLVEQIKHLIVKQNPQVQGLVIIELAAMYYAGHHPTIRDEVRRLQTETISDLVPVFERELFRHQERPADWPVTPLRVPPEKK